jgi:DNA-binding response OmpR family regulator
MKELKKIDSSIPVIVISTLSEPEKIVNIFKMAMDANFIVDFVTKPFSSDEISAAVHKIMDLQGRKEADLDYKIKEIKQLINLGENSKAREKNLELLKLLPSSPIPHFLLGLILEKEGKIEEAKKHFQAALIFEPSYDPAKKKLEKIGG